MYYLTDVQKTVDIAIQKRVISHMHQDFVEKYSQRMSALCQRYLTAHIQEIDARLKSIQKRKTAKFVKAIQDSTSQGKEIWKLIDILDKCNALSMVLDEVGV